MAELQNALRQRVPHVLHFLRPPFEDLALKDVPALFGFPRDEIEGVDVTLLADAVNTPETLLPEWAAQTSTSGPTTCPFALLGFPRSAGKGSIAGCEQDLKVNGRMVKRDPKLLVEKGLASEVGTGPRTRRSKTIPCCDKL